jgi:hypothetical protein
VGRLLELLLGPAATAAKQALFGPVMQLGIYAPAAIWFVAHKDENFTCLTYGVVGLGVMFFGTTGWLLTHRRAERTL